MSISNYNLSGDQKHNVNHFASIVKLAMADGNITSKEKEFLKKTAKHLHIVEEKATSILENYKDFPFVTPHGYDDRIELLYDYTKMIYADDNVDKKEASVLCKICIGLGFPTDNAEKVADEAIHLVMNNNNLDEFTKAIKYVNRV
ncbi:MAG TPA: hypothetical protein VJ970_02355 [Flavobacteriaceae bacterium]|nr:hypothetical protein [Flavobacteriaceae bacterium]